MTKCKDSYINRKDLIAYFGVPARSLKEVLQDAGIVLRANGTRWSVVFEALGLAADQSAKHWEELTKPLLTASQVAQDMGRTDPSIIYRWVNPSSPNYSPDFPAPIDLSFGKRPNARNRKRWRRADVIAWQSNKPQPKYRHLSKSGVVPSPSQVPSADPAPTTAVGIFSLPQVIDGGAQ